MNYQESKAYLESLAPTLTRPTLVRMARFMESLSEEADVPCIHIGGTNGKGSTVAITDSVLRAIGYKVGRFTGPHLLRWNERFHVDGEPISDADFARISTKLRGLSERFAKEYPDLGPLTWFEFLTAIAFMYFAEKKVDIAVMEVGLGGRFDATTVRTNPWLTVVTNVSLDHTHLLGDTVEKIAFEKAGIIEPGISVLTGCQGGALKEVLRVADEKSCLVHVVSSGRDGAGTSQPEDAEIALYVGGEKQNSVSLRPLVDLLQDNLALKGKHQISNGLLALIAVAECVKATRDFELEVAGFEPVVTRDDDAESESASGSEPPQRERRIGFPSPQEFVDTILKLDGDSLRAGLREVRWPGRLQQLPQSDILLDGAHNPAGAQALRVSLDQMYPGQRPLFVISSFESKDAKKLLGSLVRKGERVFVAEAQGRRASHSKEQLIAWLEELGAQGESFSTIAEAVDAARERKESNEFIVISGSFAAVKETMQHFGYACVEDSYLVNTDA